GREHLAQPGGPGPQRGDVFRRARRLVHLVAAQFRGEGGRVATGVVDQPDGDVRARHRVSVELHKTITASWLTKRSLMGRHADQEELCDVTRWPRAWWRSACGGWRRWPPGRSSRTCRRCRCC